MRGLLVTKYRAEEEQPRVRPILTPQKNPHRSLGKPATPLTVLRHSGAALAGDHEVRERQERRRGLDLRNTSHHQQTGNSLAIIPGDEVFKPRRACRNESDVSFTCVYVP